MLLKGIQNSIKLIFKEANYIIILSYAFWKYMKFEILGYNISNPTDFNVDDLTITRVSSRENVFPLGEDAINP